MLRYSSTLQKRFYHKSPYFIRNGAASLYGWIQKRRRYGGRFEQYLEFLSQSQWFSNDRLEEYQLQQTKAFLLHAERHSKYYHDLFQRHGFKPEKMQSLSDLQVLPVQNKTKVRNNMDEILPDNVSSLNPRWSHTSGTTGQGLRTANSMDCFQCAWAFRVLADSWAGIRPGMKCAYCAGHPVAYSEHRKPPFWVYDYANNWLLMSSYHLTESNLPHYIFELQKFKPDLLSGYPSSIYLLALANQHLGNPVHPRAVFTSSETLFDHQRSVIERAFDCKVYNYYGNGESCAHIAECEKGSLHMKPEHSYVELLDHNNEPVEADSEGRLVGTAFLNYAMPLVRYDIGDVAVVSKNQTCPCGRSGILVDRVVGRVEDYVVTPDGRFVGRLDHLFKDAINVRMAQIAQDSIDKIVIRIVKEPGYTKKDECSILNEARTRLGKQINIDIEYPAEIPRERNGKFRFVVSQISDKKMFSKATSAVEEFQVGRD